MKLVSEWRRGWKWSSVHLATILALAPEVYEHADVVQDYLEPNVFHHLMAGLAVLAIAARFVKQK